MSARPTDAAPRVLLADDDADVLKALQLLLKASGIQSQAVRSAAAALGALREGEYDALLADMNFARDTSSGAEGLELIEQALELAPHVPVIALTAFGSVELAVEAMRRGARDFVQKPWENERLVNVVRTQVELARALREGRRLAAENRLLREGGPPGEIVAESRAMRAVLELVERLGPSEASVLITGENGVGKGLVARALHAGSERAEHALITVNVGGLAESLFDRLFGHVRGACRRRLRPRRALQLASGGTLFLDGQTQLIAALQSELPRARFWRVRARRLVAHRAPAALPPPTPTCAPRSGHRLRRDLFFPPGGQAPACRRCGPADLPVLRAHASSAARRYREELGPSSHGESALRCRPSVRDRPRQSSAASLFRGEARGREDPGLVSERAAAQSRRADAARPGPESMLIDGGRSDATGISQARGTRYAEKNGAGASVPELKPRGAETSLRDPAISRLRRFFSACASIAASWAPSSGAPPALVWRSR
jgi:FixJ family two-component response regulator